MALQVTIFQVASWIIDGLSLALFIRVLLSWIPHNAYHPVVRFLYDVTDPLLRPFKELIPNATGIDFSPIFAFIALSLIKKLLFNILL